MDTITRPVPSLASDSPLTLTDRCDRCGSRAYVRATLPSGSVLLFCGHHGNEHRANLLVAGASIHDETASIDVARESSAA
ncbi:MAG: hypothetical protein JWM64_2762 [Frankiales bacterium]|nr:hypothetical protein [Frankiales bacterium]